MGPSVVLNRQSGTSALRMAALLRRGSGMALFVELKRRKVFKIGAAYLVVAWLAIQVASIGFPAFDLPPRVLRLCILGAARSSSQIIRR